MNSTLNHSMIETNGIRLHVVQAGPLDGPLVILLHGFPEFWYGWRAQIAALAEAGFRVWVPDQRGYHLSDKPRGIQAYHRDALARDVVGLIDAAGRGTALVAGHDWGASVAWWLAAHHPDRVERLAILNVPHHRVMAQTLKRSWSQRRKSWYMFFFQLPRLPEMILAANSYRALADSLRRSSRPGTFSKADLDRYREAWAQPGALTAMLNYYRAALRTPSPGEARIHMPTRLIWGARQVPGRGDGSGQCGVVRRGRALPAARRHPLGAARGSRAGQPPANQLLQRVGRRGRGILHA